MRFQDEGQGTNVRSRLLSISSILNFKLILDRCDVDNHRIESNTTVESAVNNPSVLLGDGTDLLILLLFYFDFDSNDIIFQINENQLFNDENMGYPQDNVNTLTGRMPYNVISTSRMFGKEKSTAVQKILNEIRHREPAMMFMNPK